MEKLSKELLKIINPKENPLAIIYFTAGVAAGLGMPETLAGFIVALGFGNKSKFSIPFFTGCCIGAGIKLKRNYSILESLMGNR